MDTSLEEMMLLQGGGHEKAQAREESSWARGGGRGSRWVARARAVLGPPEDGDHLADAARGATRQSGARARGDGGDKIEPEELALPASPASASTAASPFQAHLDAAEKELLRQALRDHEGDRRAAARAMGMALSTLYAKLKRYQL